MTAVLVALTLSVLGTAAPLQVREVRYSVTDLGTLPDCDTTYAEAVNDTGWVVGYAYRHIPPHCCPR